MLKPHSVILGAMGNTRFNSAILALLLGLQGVCAIADDADSGFLPDYSRLHTSPLNERTRYYLAPGAQQKLASYSKIMVDNPEIFLAEDSPYKGIKPARLNVIAEAFRQKVVDALSSDYAVVDEAGPATLYLKLALTDLSISKNRTRLLGYTPVGLVYRAGRSAVQSDYQNAVRQVSLIDLKIEGEVLDSQSSEMIGEFVDDHGNRETPQNWDELLVDMQHFGKVIRCQLENARSSDDDWVNCMGEQEADPTA